MFYADWEILLVDDEPDVLAVTELAMRGFDVYGMPLKLHSTDSKEAALRFLRQRPDRQFSRIAVAFVDVVMESDSAGLELCQAIREDMHNHLMQIFVRTGQPGIAPERVVIDRYDINGYFTKAEATEDKLYSLVKSGVRQHMLTVWSQGAYRMLSRLTANAESQESITRTYCDSQGAWDSILLATAPESAARAGIGHGLTINGQVINTGLWMDEATVLENAPRLTAMDGVLLSPDGDKYVHTDSTQQLIRIAPHGPFPEINYYFSTTFAPPMAIVMLVHSYFKSLASLWARAKA